MNLKMSLVLDHLLSFQILVAAELEYGLIPFFLSLVVSFLLTVSTACKDIGIFAQTLLPLPSLGAHVKRSHQRKGANYSQKWHDEAQRSQCIWVNCL